MRFGLVILPEYPWTTAAPMWRAAEEMGFDHAWTYDHLVWGGLVGHPWHATMPTLTAAATVTARIGLGTFVASPNFRHPYPFHRDLATLDDVSGGRAICGIGAGGEPDLTILGGADLTPRQRVDRLGEFVDLLNELQTTDHVDRDGEWFTVREARTAPGPVQRPRVPFVVAANGPRALRIAARHGQGWVTTGRGGDDREAWWRGVAELVARFERATADVGRAPERRYLSLDAAPGFSFESVDRFTDDVGRAAELGFTDVVAHRPRADEPYRGDLAVLEDVAARLPGLREAG